MVLASSYGFPDELISLTASIPLHLEPPVSAGAALCCSYCHMSTSQCLCHGRVGVTCCMTGDELALSFCRYGLQSVAWLQFAGMPMALAKLARRVSMNQRQQSG